MEHVDADKSKLVGRTRDAFIGASLSPAMDGRNSNGSYSDGRYLYVLGKHDDGVNCVLAYQGLTTRLTAAEETDTTYDAIVTFRYCSHKSVQEIIEIFDGITLNLNGRRRAMAGVANGSLLSHLD